MKNLLWAGLVALMALLPFEASAQIGPGGGVQQQGTVTANDCAAWVGPGVIKDSGSACGSGGGLTITGTVGDGVVIGPTTTTIQDSSAVTSSAFPSGIGIAKTVAFGAGSASGPINSPMWATFNATGTATDTVTTNFSLWQQNQDNVDASAAANGVFNWEVAAVCCGPLAKGGRQLGTFFLSINNVPGDTNQNYTALQGSTQASVNVGGTTGQGNGRGNIFGLNPRAILVSGGTFWHLLNAAELDTGASTGSSYELGIGLDIAQAGNGTTTGTVGASIVDIGIVIGNGVGTGLPRRDYMMVDGGYDGFPALKTTGTWFACYPHANNNSTNPCGAIGSFADLSNFSSVSGNIILGPASNGKIDGSFDFFGGYADFSSTTTPTPAAGHLTFAGNATAPSLAANGEASIYTSGTNGINLIGKGNTNDIAFLNSGGTVVFQVTTGGLGVSVPNGAANVARLQVTGATIANNGFSLPSANVMVASTNSLESFRITAAQLIQYTAITSDVGLTDATVCEDTTLHGLHSGSGTIGICLGTSSLRYKHDIADLDVGLSQIMGLVPISYKLNADHGDPNKVLYGFTAEQGGQVLPKLMTEDESGRPNTFDYLGIVPVLVKAVQQQQAEIETLKGKIR